MSASTNVAVPVAGEPQPAVVVDSAAVVDQWPHTQRVMPWFVAIFLGCVCLVPIDSVTLRASLPIDPKLDRILLAGISLVWILAYWSGGPQRPRFPRLGAVGIAMWLWILSSFLSIVVNLPTLVLNDQVALTAKKFVLLMVFVVFFMVVVSVIRPGEVRAFLSYWMGLTGILAVGAIYSYLTKTEPFRDVAGHLFGGPFNVTTYQVATIGGVNVVGPTAHGLALTTMLVMPMPFILMRALDADVRNTRLGYSALLVLCAIGSTTSGRKSAIVVPIVIGLAMFAYRPKALIRFWPVILAFVVLVPFVTPGALSSIASRASSKNTAAASSTKDRLQDFGGSVPDFIAHPLLGKGYGSNDPGTYRVFDDQWLSSIIEVGLVGVGCMVGLLVSAWYFAHRLSKRASTAAARGQAVAAAAAVIAFGVSMALYDTLAFVQSFYLLLFIVAITAVMNDGESYADDAVA